MSPLRSLEVAVFTFPWPGESIVGRQLCLGSSAPTPLGGLELDPDLSAPPAAPVGQGDVFPEDGGTPIPIEPCQGSELRGNMHFVSRSLPHFTGGKRKAPAGT